MKKLFIIGSLAASAWMVSCEEEDVPEFVNQDYLAGTWVAKQIGTSEDFNNGDEIITYVYYEDVVNDPGCDEDNLMLNTDKTFALNDYENNGGCVNEGITGSYTRTDNRILLSYTDDANQPQLLTMTINTLTYTELIVSYSMPGSPDLVFVKFQKEQAQ